MNDLDLCLEVVSRSRQPLRYIWLWISRKPLENKIETWFQRTTNSKWHMGYRMVTCPMTSRDPQMCCEAVRSAILATAWRLVAFRFICIIRVRVQVRSKVNQKLIIVIMRRSTYCYSRDSHKCANEENRLWCIDHSRTGVSINDVTESSSLPGSVGRLYHMVGPDTVKLQRP